MFFSEKDTSGAKIDYFKTTTGSLRLIPEGASLAALKMDYAAMLEDGLLALDQPDFSAMMEKCSAIQDKANQLLRNFTKTSN